MKHWENPSPKKQDLFNKIRIPYLKNNLQPQKTIFSKNILYSVTNDQDILLTKVVK